MINICNPENLTAEDQVTLENRKKNVDGFEEREKQFFETYYAMFHDHKNDVEVINRKVVMTHTLLQSLNIEHYFFEMLAEPNTINRVQLGHTIPMIEFKNDLHYAINGINYLNSLGVKSGECMHWNHDGNEFLAEYLLKYIKEQYHG